MHNVDDANIPQASTLSSTSLVSMFAPSVDRYGTAPIALFDELLSLFHHPNFHPGGPEVPRAADVLELIAERKRRSMHDTGIRPNTPEEQPRSRNRVPPIIVEIVSEYFNSERRPFHRTLHAALDSRRDYYSSVAQYYTYPNDGLVTLENMSLVDRTWASIVQRYLRRRIYVSGLLDMRLLLKSKRLGPWSRELGI